jgi:hypothetical protein
MGYQADVRDRIVQVLNGIEWLTPVTTRLNGQPVQPAVANPWDAWPVWDFTEVAGFTGEQLTTHWAVFVVMPAGDRAGLIAAGDLVVEVVAPHLSNELPARIERVEPLQLTFEEGGIKPVVRIALNL